MPRDMRCATFLYEWNYRSEEGADENLLLIPTSVLRGDGVPAFLNAIGIDTKDFAQNGVGLPNFAAAASAADAELALSVQFGASQLTNIRHALVQMPDQNSIGRMQCHI